MVTSFFRPNFELSSGHAQVDRNPRVSKSRGTELDLKRGLCAPILTRPSWPYLLALPAFLQPQYRPKLGGLALCQKLGCLAIRQDHIRNEVDVRSMAGSVVVKDCILS